MDFFGLLRRLTEKSDLTTIEKQDAMAVISNLEQLNAFGIAGRTQTQAHTCSAVIETGKCAHCGEQMQEPRQVRRGRWG